MELGAASGVPQRHGLIVAGRGEALAVGGDGERLDVDAALLVVGDERRAGGDVVIADRADIDAVPIEKDRGAGGSGGTLSGVLTALATPADAPASTARSRSAAIKPSLFSTEANPSLYRRFRTARPMFSFQIYAYLMG